MAEQTNIEWTDHTFNPVRGCTKVSPGCTNCYAEKMSHRNPDALGEWGPNGRRIVAADAYWQQPYRWNRLAQKAGIRRRVFCASLADVFEDRSEWQAARRRLGYTITETPWLDWLLLTKRPENWQMVADQTWGIRPHNPWPPNLWLGVSVENQEYAQRLHHLADIPARIKFVSAEPLLGPLVLSGRVDGLTMNWLSPNHPRGVHWVIVGGESGPRARPCNLEWIHSLRDQCRAARVPVFIKQLGSNPRNNMACTGSFYLDDAKGGDMEEWPADLRVRQFPERAWAQLQPQEASQ